MPRRCGRVAVLDAPLHRVFVDAGRGQLVALLKDQVSAVKVLEVVVVAICVSQRICASSRIKQWTAIAPKARPNALAGQVHVQDAREDVDADEVARDGQGFTGDWI